MDPKDRVKTLERTLRLLRAQSGRMALRAGFVCPTNGRPMTVYAPEYHQARELKDEATAFDCIEACSEYLAASVDSHRTVQVVIVGNGEPVADSNTNYARQLCADVVARSRRTSVVFYSGLQAMMDAHRLGPGVIGGDANQPVLLVSVDRSALPNTEPGARIAVAGVCCMLSPDGAGDHEIEVADVSETGFTIRRLDRSTTVDADRRRVAADLFTVFERLVRLERDPSLSGPAGSGSVEFLIGSGAQAAPSGPVIRRILTEALGFADWRDDLGQRRLVEVGADSRLAAEISSRADVAMGIAVPVDWLLGDTTIDEIVAAIERGERLGDAHRYVLLGHDRYVTGAC